MKAKCWIHLTNDCMKKTKLGPGMYYLIEMAVEKIKFTCEMAQHQQFVSKCLIRSSSSSCAEFLVNAGGSTT